MENQETVTHDQKKRQLAEFNLEMTEVFEQNKNFKTIIIIMINDIEINMLIINKK